MSPSSPSSPSSLRTQTSLQQPVQLAGPAGPLSTPIARPAGPAVGRRGGERGRARADNTTRIHHPQCAARPQHPGEPHPTARRPPGEPAMSCPETAPSCTVHAPAIWSAAAVARQGGSGALHRVVHAALLTCPTIGSLDLCTTYLTAIFLRRSGWACSSSTAALWLRAGS